MYLKSLALFVFCAFSLGMAGGVMAGRSTGQGQLVHLQKKLKKRDLRSRVSAIRALSRLGKKALKALPALLGVMADKRPEVRAAALYAMGQMGPAAGAAIPVMVKSLHDHHPWVRGYAAFALARMGPKAKTALLQASREKHPQVRQLAAISLVRMGVRTPRMAGLLAETTRSNKAWLRFYGLRAMRMMPTLPPVALKAVVSLLGDKSPRIRQQAMLLAGKHRVASAIPVLLKMRGDKHLRTRRMAIRALGMMRLRRPGIVSVLQTDAYSKNVYVRWEARQALRLIGVALKPKARKAATPSSRPTVRRGMAVSRPASRPTSAPVQKGKK